jgi:mRNA interferase RelE/StbE
VSWRVEVARDARKELARLPVAIQVRVARALLGLEGDPFPHGSKKLRNRNGWRIRVGDYRVLYSAETKAQQITIVAIGHRREVYRD